MNWNAVNFDWNRARAFLVTAEEGSLSAAARALNMTQPTLGRQVAALEQELNVTLFERSHNGLILTESGLQLLEFVRQMGEAASDFSLTASGQEQALEGTVCITAGELDAVYRLPAIAEKIRLQEPGIELEFVVSNEVSDLKTREADIALRSFRPTQPDLIARRLFEERIWFFGTSDYVKQFNNTFRFSDQSPLSVIAFNRAAQYKKSLEDKGWPSEGIQFPIIAPFQLLQIELIKHGLGVTLLPEDIGDSIDGIERAFTSDGPFMTLDIWLVTHRELRTNRRVRRVYDLIVETLGNGMPAISRQQ